MICEKKKTKRRRSSRHEVRPITAKLIGFAVISGKLAQVDYEVHFSMFFTTDETILGSKMQKEILYKYETLQVRNIVLVLKMMPNE